MEVAIIDWKKIDSRFVKDDLYEHINAPQWLDFSAPDVDIDDESWFCRPDCNHPKTVEDFYRQTPANPKKSSGSSERQPLGDLTRRDSTVKKRGLAFAPVFPNGSKNVTNLEDSENRNPNFSTPLNPKSKSFKETVKSSTEKRQIDEKTLRNEPHRSLKSTLSARNLFAGGDILSKVSEFCNELKKLALRAKDRERVESCLTDSSSDESTKFSIKEKERKPLLDANSETYKAQQKVEKPRRKARYEDENTPVRVDLKCIKQKEQENMLPIRTCPPTPQCISATRVPSKASPLKAINLKTPEKGILQDTGYRKLNAKKDQVGCEINEGGQQAKGLDVFWFLKPCNISS